VEELAPALLALKQAIARALEVASPPG